MIEPTRSPTYAISSYANSDLCNIKRSAKTKITTFYICALNISLREWKHNDTKVVKKYCWVITQAADQVTVCGSLYFTFTHLNIYIYRHIVYHRYDKLCVLFMYLSLFFCSYFVVSCYFNVLQLFCCYSSFVEIIEM